MGIHVVHFLHQGIKKWGIVNEKLVRPIEKDFDTLASLLAEGIDQIKSLADHQKDISLDEVTLLSPVTKPARIVCQGANYGTHRAESGLEAKKPPFNLIFTKADSTLSGPRDPIICPDHVKLLDYEIELGLIIGKEISETQEVTDENLHEYVAGLVITNDVSARDIQLGQTQWYKGKSYRTFCPVGPYVYLLEKEDIPLINNLELNLWVNGELRQSTNTENLLFKPAETLTELSGLMDFSPGDLLLTGTTGGVALRLSPEVTEKLLNPVVSGEEKMQLILDSQSQIDFYLKNNDVIRCEIKSVDGKINLGVLENKVTHAVPVKA
ncbi:fumarylacetoacetate hydrolase family protein [Peribacillus asahii]|uniref:fumarylacetoacetate hydrolase family protein n=1 Tax=Peribacillus asahii TaxID=228899 RepID=UPI0020793B6F|nr:fumarylacetoacetate hydrolase family protein [Peribacillus asahii]USK87567.1 fumarylacetoacetate hydrolase family protein [Peribacillus asahii]